MILRDKIDASGAVMVVDDLPRLEADAEQLMQLFLILIENAITFSLAGEAPYIRISAMRQDDNWCFVVADNGIGISPEFHGKIFGLFQRLHTDEEYPGAGIGLALAQKIVNRHGGKLGVNSARGKGAAFHFTLQNRTD